MQLPRDGIQDSSQAVFGDATAKERIGGQGSKGVVADFCISGRSTLPDEIKICIGAKRRSIQEDQPYVDTDL